MIDPVLGYSGYLGNAGSDQGNAIAVDPAGNIYLTGFTASTDFNTTVGSFRAAKTGSDQDVFVAKLNPTASALIYSSLVGGSGRSEEGNEFVAKRQALLLIIEPATRPSKRLIRTTTSPHEKAATFPWPPATPRFRGALVFSNA